VVNAVFGRSFRWTIKARITSKSDIRRWSNAKGEGTLFSIDLLDSDGGEIRATFFKEACDKWFPVLEEGKVSNNSCCLTCATLCLQLTCLLSTSICQVYTFSGGTLKMVQNKQFSNIKNQYELTFSQHSAIMAAADDVGIQKQHYQFVKINEIANAEVGSTIDVIAIVRHASEVSEIVSTKQSGKVMQKRELTLVDDTLSEVRLTLWGEKATSNQYDWHSSPVAAFKGLKIGDYGGRSLSAGAGTSIQISPEIPEGVALYQWRMGFQNGVLPTGASLTTSGGAGE
jgi:replication factor A1